jgi:hypothetical protein
MDSINANYRLERFCISGAGIKLTELMPNILRIEAKDTRQGCTVWVTDGFGNLGIEHAEMPRSRFIWPHSNDCEEALATAKEKGDVRQGRDLPAPLLLKMYITAQNFWEGDAPQCCTQGSNCDA